MLTFTHRVSSAALLLAAFVATAFLAFGQETPEACEKYKNVPIPRQDQPTPQQAQALAKCDSEDLYYGTHHAADPAKARLCAYAEIADPYPFFTGPAILMMVYANGKGAARNFDLAMRFACEVKKHTDDFTGLEELEKLKAENWKGSDFDVCGHWGASKRVVIDGQPVDVYDTCAERDAAVADFRRGQKLDAILAKWGLQDRQEFTRFQKAKETFFNARSDFEIDQTGAGRVFFVSEERRSLEDHLVSALTQFEGGKTPNFTSADFAKADKELNAVYVKTLKAVAAGTGTITVEGVRDTERAWLSYLVAWVAFARQKYPQVTADSWRTWLTQERIKQLEELTIL